ncbi:MAG: CocE/NonD family hydrolase [Myxococcota bacterium]
MRIVEDFPHRVRELPNVWIPVDHDVRLAARIWLPEDAEEHPVPAVLEYIPYRKRDRTSERDALNHPYFAGHGYAAVRVDLRGSGESDGVLAGEYLETELTDGEAVLRWLAEQPWCDGNVGLFGISWGGFNGLQLAARQPPELKAVITCCSTDDRYADDVHYMGGCMLGDNLSWASYMFAINTLPPDPHIVGDRWREMWWERLEGSGLWLDGWLRHQRRDAFWKHGSICEDYSAVKAPVMAVSGWADGYSNAVFRMLAALDVPRMGLIGPWSHKYPHMGVPGPAIGFLQECVRWWDQHLKGRETGIMDEPMLRAWMQDSVPPTTSYDHRPGRWVAERTWPSPEIRDEVRPLARARIAEPGEDVEETPVTVQSPLTVGLFAGKWCSYAATPDLPHDQREEDGGAYVFESDPLKEPLEILGSPAVDLEVSADKPVAMAAVRLSDVAPDDKATRVTYGVLNLTHRDSHEDPEPLTPGRRYRVRVELNDIAQTFPAGHRLRVSVSTSYWPLAWPPPESTRLTMITGASSLVLPVRPPRETDRELTPFGPPECAPPLKVTQRGETHYNWRVIRDLDTDRSTLEVVKDNGVLLYDDIDLEIRERADEWYSTEGDDFDSIRGETRTDLELRRKGWSVRSVTRTVLTSDAYAFHLRAELDAWEGDDRVYSRNWKVRIPRDLV